MSRTPQTYATHVRWFPVWHFFAFPVTALAGFHLLWNAIKNPSTIHFLETLFVFAVAGGIFAARIMAISVQDRVIRLEMRLRLKEILPAALQPRINDLTREQYVALRFASDAEMPALVERVLKGELDSQKAIKLAIKDWQGDYLRA